MAPVELEPEKVGGLVYFGFDAVFASRFPPDADTPLDEAAILSPGDKPRLAAELRSDH